MPVFTEGEDLVLCPLLLCLGGVGVNGYKIEIYYKGAIYHEKNSAFDMLHNRCNQPDSV